MGGGGLPSEEVGSLVACGYIQSKLSSNGTARLVFQFLDIQKRLFYNKVNEGEHAVQNIDLEMSFFLLIVTAPPRA